MWTSLTLLSWLRFAAACAMLLGPGYAVFSVLPNRARFDRTQSIALAIGLSIAVWATLLAWLQWLRITLSPVVVVSLFGLSWAIGLWRVRPWQQLGRLNWQRLALWGVIGLSLGVCVGVLRDLPLAPGSDVYHHTLITQLIVERGLLPDSYLPYADLVTFTYHFGFHALAAALSWLSGLSPLVVVPVTAQVLVAASALTVALLAEVIVRRPLAGLISAIGVGLLGVFPAYFINWGRDTQLTGLVILPVLLALAWDVIESGLNRRGLIFVGILAAGLALTHYRVAIMAASGFAVIFWVSGLQQRWSWRRCWKTVVNLVGAALFAGVLIAPWVGHLIAAARQGYAVDISKVEPAFFALERLGLGVLNYPTNWIMLGLTGLAIAIGWWRRDRVVVGLSLWSSVMLLFSTPRFAGIFMDTISVVISLYIPIAILIAWLVTALIERWPRIQWPLRVVMIALAAWGAVTITGIVDPQGIYTTPDDLQATAWVKANTPPSARFMVNVFPVYGIAKYITGQDTGYWLPLLANRAVFVPPLVYPSERVSSPDFADRLAALSQAQAHMTTPETQALLKREGITHVYLGARGTFISADELSKSPNFQLVYQNASVRVYQVIQAP